MHRLGWAALCAALAVGLTGKANASGFTDGGTISGSAVSVGGHFKGDITNYTGPVLGGGRWLLVLDTPAPLIDARLEYGYEFLYDIYSRYGTPEGGDNYWPSDHYFPGALGSKFFQYGNETIAIVDVPRPYRDGVPGFTNYTEYFFKGGFSILGTLPSETNGSAWSFAATPVSADYIWSPGHVPEPATWAMMLVGFFGLGSALRRRRPRSVRRARCWWGERDYGDSVRNSCP
jgi:hypothetical protein